MTEANEELGGGKGRDYDVGYGKGAPETLWKKGQSGNPSGKKKEEPEISGTPDDPDGIGKMLQDLDNELVVVLFGKKKVRMPRVELRLRQMFDKAIKGGLKQARQVYLLAVKYYAPEALGDSSHSHVYKSDMAELTGDEPADRDVDLSERSQSKKARAKRGPAQRPSRSPKGQRSAISCVRKSRSRSLERSASCSVGKRSSGSFTIWRSKTILAPPGCSTRSGTGSRATCRKVTTLCT